MRLVQEKSEPVDGLETIHTYIPNEIYQQILKDVARSGSHISHNATEKETENFQEQLTQLMCWVLHRHSQLKLVFFKTNTYLVVIVKNYNFYFIVLQNKIMHT